VSGWWKILFEMSSEIKTVSVIPLTRLNYATWKIQCRMALMKDSLWSIVNGEEVAPEQSQPDRYVKFCTRRDRALAIIVLSVDPKLYYLVGDPSDPVTVWQKLADQFQKRSWGNKFHLRRKLNNLRLKDNECMQNHIKAMTEIFDELAVVDTPLSNEDKVIYLLSSLPESYNTLVTALEVNEDVPKMEIVTERLLFEEQKIKSQLKGEVSCEGVLLSKQKNKKGPKCYNCGKIGHIKVNCRWLNKGKNNAGFNSQKSNLIRVDENDSEESAGLIATHSVSIGSVHNLSNRWIIDSGATAAICLTIEIFETVKEIKPVPVSLGDGRIVKAVGCGNIIMTMNLHDTKHRKCTLSDVLYVPELSYNLISVSKASKAGKITKFTEDHCEIFDSEQKLVAVACKLGNLYYLQYSNNKVNMAETVNLNEDIWHKRFGHLNAQSLKTMSLNDLVLGLNYDHSHKLSFCEACADGKNHRVKFPSHDKISSEPLQLIHSDVCGKMNSKSLGGGEYFLTFIDDCTRYVWVYILKRKEEVFEKFVQWKNLVEKQSGKSVKILRTDNGGEYKSKTFANFLSAEGIRHEYTVPKTPEQNGVSERMNRTLVEAVRSMLSHSELPDKFWAEALSTAVYLRNRSLTRALCNITPYEAYTGVKPNVSNLRIFGCIAYAHVPKDERKKLDPKSRKCFMLGYGTETKGYRLFDINRNRVIFSRDVLFNENDYYTENKSVSRNETNKFEIDFSLTDSDDDSKSQEEVPVTSTQIRRSVRERRAPDRYGEWTTVANSTSEPTSVAEAMESKESFHWQAAMEKEMQSMHSNEVWTLVELPAGRKTVSNRWVFKQKVGSDGEICQYKARLVAQGFSQRYGIDYDETFSPVVRFESIRTVIALSAQYGMSLHQMDVTAAFLNSNLDEEIYMKQPEGFVVTGSEKMVCRLNRSIYGLKQSPRCWNSSLHSCLLELGFCQTSGDPCIYISSVGEAAIICIYVDDLLIASVSDNRMRQLKLALSKRYEMKDMGELHYFLGVKITQNRQKGTIFISQPSYIEGLLDKFGLTNSRPVSTPVDNSVKLVKSSDEDDVFDAQVYQSAIGGLLYLALKTRPDISYAVSSVAKFAAAPAKQHWVAVKRVMRYLRGTANHGLLYSVEDSPKCTGFSDADWAGDGDDRRSTSGYTFQMSGAAISWSSKKQSCVALFSYHWSLILWVASFRFDLICSQ